jgi:peptidoglycan/LPS O-acetylase OafA/YrhL
MRASQTLSDHPSTAGEELVTMKVTRAEPTSPQDPTCPKVARQLWADAIRVAAVLMVFLYHFTPDWLASTGTEPSTSQQFISDHFAEWAIAAFVVLSGFSLWLTLSAREQKYTAYLSRRLTRIFVPYWTIAVPFALVGFALEEAAWADIWKLPVWLLGLGPVTPDTYLPISEAWWYVSLALQIGLIIPLLQWLRRRLGLLPLTLCTLALNTASMLAVNAAGPDWQYLNQELVLCRLTEVMIGVVAAELILARRQGSGEVLAPLASMALIMLAAPLLDLLQMRTSWQATLVLAALFAAGAIFSVPTTLRARGLTWAAALSYCFYLSHAPVSKYTGRLLVRFGIHNTIIGLLLVLIVCVFVALIAYLFSERFVAPLLSRLFGRLLIRNRGSSG